MFWFIHGEDAGVLLAAATGSGAVWISVACADHVKKFGRIAGLCDWSSFQWVWKGQEMSKIFWRKGFILSGLNHLPFFFFFFFFFFFLQEKSRAEQPFLTEASKLQKLVRSGSLSNQIAKMSYFKPKYRWMPYFYFSKELHICPPSSSFSV